MPLDYIYNFSIFSLMVLIPFVIVSLTHHRPLTYYRIWIGLYGGIVSFTLVMLSIHERGFTYDIRYAPVILVFAYFGPVAGSITSFFGLTARLMEGGNWPPAIIGFTLITVGFIVIHSYIKRLPAVRKITILFCAYATLYIITIYLFNILLDNPIFHLEYLTFVLLGVIVGGLLIESYAHLHRVNQTLATMYKRVEESEAKYRLIAENTSDLIMVMNKDKSITYLSPSHQSVLGYEIEEIKTADTSKLIHPKDRPTFINAGEKLFENKEPFSLEFRLRHIKGHWVDFESRCGPVQGEGQEIENIVMISRDVSKRKEAEEILVKSEKLSIVGELAAGVAHEIRNPLTTIKGFIQLNKQAKEPDFYNDILLSELNRIENITSELLSLGKPLAVQMVEVDLRKLVEHIIDLLTPKALICNIQFRVKAEEHTNFFINAEKDQMKQVFLNLLKNAMESMSCGGEIKINLRESGKEMCSVSIEDQGCGIPEELLPRLGEPFYTLKEKGTGLGLMICHKIIKEHNGTITYKSKVNEGTVVEVQLPLLNKTISQWKVDSAPCF